MATQIDSSITNLMAELDDPESSANRDVVQKQIQELDAIAADKRQEADRLRSEAELIQINASAEGTEISDSSNIVSENSQQDNAVSEITEVEINQNIKEAQTLIQSKEITSGNYKSLNANITFNAIRTKIDSSAQMRREAKELVEKIEKMQPGVDRNQSSEKLAALNSELQANDTKIAEVVSNSNAAEISYFQSANDAVMAEIQNLPSSERDTIPFKELSSKSSELAMQLSENESNLQKGLITNSEKISRELQLINELDALNTTLDNIVSAREATMEVADTKDEPIQDTKTDTAATQIDEIPLLEKSANYQPEQGKEYITPIFRSFESEMPEQKKSDYIANNKELQVSPILNAPSNRDTDVKLLSSATKIDAKGLSLLKGSPEKLDYLTSSIKADSLKKIERKKADFAKSLTTSAKETLGEVKRLENAKGHEENADRKSQIQERIDRLNATANENFEKASIAAYQAEDIRNMRKSEEEIIARSAAKMKPNDLAELNAVLSNKTYTIVPSDLASADIHPVNSPVKVAAKEVSESSDLSEKSPIYASETDVVTVNENLNSIDEKLLLEAHGNWLNVVEVIADKDDFSDVKESLFIDTDQPVYSDLKPIPMNPELPVGLIFQVQVGAFRNKIPQDLFGEFAPIMGEKLDNGITRYRAGVFTQYRSALEAKTKIRARGYSDAFVVAYINGERLTGAQAQDILRQAQVKENVTAEELAQNKAAETPSGQVDELKQTEDVAKIDTPQLAKVDYYSDPEAAPATQVEVTPGLFYTVQVGVYSKPVKLDKLFNLVELNSELTASNYIRYTSGKYSSVEAARVRKAQAISKGVTDAFITAYYNGKRISLAKAEQLLAQNGKSILSNKMTSPSVLTPEKSTVDSKPVSEVDSVKYVIILGSFAGDIPQAMANIFLERPDIKIRRVTAPNGVSIYASPEFDSKAEADEFLKQSRKAGIDSAVMGKVVNGKISAVTAK